MGLLAEASGRDVVAVSTDDLTGYWIIDTSAGTDSDENEPAGDLLEFLITHKAGAGPG